MGIFLQARLQFAERFAGFHHDPQNLQRAHNPVACGRVIAEDHVSALLATDVVAAAHHFFDHVAVANLGADHFASRIRDHFVEPEIAHDGCDERVVREPSALKQVERGNRHDFVPVDHLAFFIAQ